MSKLITKLSAGAIAVALALPVQAQDALTPDSVVATVNGTEITLGHMLMARASLPEQYQSLPDEVLWDGILDQVIQQSVLGAGNDGKVSRQVELALENERRSLIAAQAVEGIVKDAVTEDAVQAAYSAQFLQSDPSEEYNASHILVETEEEASALVDQLRAGGDFAEAAREHSTGPSGPNGGALGWFGPGMMVPEFESAVASMDVGAISDPVQTQFGWHVITLNEKRLKEAPALEEVRGEIEAQISQEAVSKRISDLTEQADITRIAKDDVDVSILSKIELLQE